MTPMRKHFNKSYANELLKVAKGDLASAKVLMEHPGGRPENTFFLMQQAIEKSLKALLCFLGHPIPMTHDIAALLAILPDSVGLPPDTKSLTAFTEFASVRRYEEADYAYTRDEIVRAYAAAEATVEWASKAVTNPNPHT